MTVREINLKYDMPPAAVALQRMENELAGARAAASRWPGLRQDRDWGRENDGITVVVLR